MHLLPPFPAHSLPVHRGIDRYEVDRIRLRFSESWVRIVAWLTSLGHTKSLSPRVHEKLALLRLSLHLVELRARRDEQSSKHFEIACEHAQWIAPFFTGDVFEYLYDRLAVTEIKAGRLKIAAYWRLRKRIELPPELPRQPPPPYAALAMPVPPSYVQVNARSST